MSCSKEFNYDNEHIYPTVTLCFRYPLLEEKLLKFGEGINVSTYTSFLIGDLWDNRMAQIDLEKQHLGLSLSSDPVV